MTAKGIKAIITGPAGHQISRVSFHPDTEVAKATVMKWVQSNLDFCERKNLTMSYELIEVEDKVIGQVA